MSAAAPRRTILLDTTSAEEIVNAERQIYKTEVQGMQREKQTLLTGQPWNNAVLLGTNIVMAGLFFIVTSLNAGRILPPEIVWLQPLVGGSCAVAAGSLMYAINAIAYKLPTIKDTATKLMIWPVWIAMLCISGILSAFIALLLVNGADAEMDIKRLTMGNAERTASAEIVTVQTATRQLDIWSEAAATARSDQSAARQRLRDAQAAKAAWAASVDAKYTYGSEAANLRLRNEDHYEHKPHIEAIESAETAIRVAGADLVEAETKMRAWEMKLAAAEEAKRTALSARNDSSVIEESPWDETMGDMASMFGRIGLRFESGAQFKAFFAVMFALVVTVAPPFWSYQTGASVAPEVDEQAQRMDSIHRQGQEMRQQYRGGASSLTARVGSAPGIAPLAPTASHAPLVGAADHAAATGAAAPEGPPPVSEAATMGSLVDIALDLGEVNTALPCGLSQTRFEELYATNYEKVARILQDAEGRQLASAGIGPLKKKYGGNDEVANMLKHALYLEGHGEYITGGSIRLYNPAEAQSAA